MSELLNFPFKNQLNEPLLDGLPNENAGMDCVPTSLAAGMQYLTSKQFTGEELVHAVYGRNYKGGTAAVDYAPYCSAHGVKIYSISGDPAQLAAAAHQHLAQGHPVLCTIPAPSVPPANRLNPGMSHVVVFYKDSAGVLVAMNPWQAFSQANSDAWWMARFCFNQIWIMERGSMSGVPQGWKDDGSTLTAPNGVRVVFGFRSWILAHPWDAGNVPLAPEYHADQVLLHNSSVGPGQRLLCRDCMLWYTTKTGVIQEPYLGLEADAEYKQIAALQSQVASLEAQLKSQPAPNQPNSIRAELTAVDQALQDVIKKVV